MHNFHSSVDVVLLQCVNPNRNAFTTKGGVVYGGGEIEMKLCGRCCVFSFVSKALCSSLYTLLYSFVFSALSVVAKWMQQLIQGQRTRHYIVKFVDLAPLISEGFFCELMNDVS